MNDGANENAKDGDDPTADSQSEFQTIEEQNSQVKSRSADPGQSSYGGFKDEGTSTENEHSPEEGAKP